MKNFYMKQKVFSFRDRYKVFDQDQNVIYHCEGKLFSLSRKMKFIETSTDTLLFNFRRKILSFLAKYYLTDPDDKEVAVVKRQFSILKPKVEIESSLGNITLEGDYFAHNFTLFEDGTELANVQKKWISWGDSYVITIQDEARTDFLLAIIILIDSIFHENHNQNRR